MRRLLLAFASVLSLAAPVAAVSPPLPGDLVISTFDADEQDFVRRVRPTSGETYRMTAGPNLTPVPTGLVVDLVARRVYMGDGGPRLYFENLDTGLQTLLSSSLGDQPVGSGVPVGVSSLVIAADGSIIYSSGSNVQMLDPTTLIRSPFASGANALWGIAHLSDGDYVAADLNADKIWRVDSSTGELTLISSLSMGTGPSLSFPTCVVENSSGDLYVSSAGNDGVLGIDLATGDRWIVSGPSVGSGPAMNSPLCLVEASDGRIIVTDGSLQTVFAVDPTTGDRSVLSSSTVGTGASLQFVRPIIEDVDGSLLVGAGGTVVRIDPTTGDRTALLSSVPGELVPIGTAWGLAIDSDGSIVTGSGQSIVRLVPPNWDRVALGYTPFYIPVGSGPDMLVRHVSLHPLHGAVAAGGDSIVAVNPTTGDRTLLSGAGQGSGPLFTELIGSAAGPGDTLYACDFLDEMIYAIDLASGDRSVVSSGVVGSGPTLVTPYAMTIEPTGTLLVLTGGSILRVDPATGDRELVSGAGQGSGPELLGPRDIDVDSRGRIFVTDYDPVGSEDDVILRIDPVSGNRVALVSPFGPGVGNANSLAVTPGLALPVLPSLSLPVLALLAMTLLAAGAGSVRRNRRS